MNSLVIVLFLSGMVATIMLRKSMHKGIAHYNQVDSAVCEISFDYQIQSNPINMDTEGTMESVRINGVSVLSGSCE